MGWLMRRGITKLYRVVVEEAPTERRYLLPWRLYVVGTEKGPYQTLSPAKALRTRLAEAGGRGRIDVTELDWKELGE
ncbi:hypothetical protein ACFC26_07815 [Kitasatospora purpeofusca]|uniref:hypothetical protein n=1 Tax=Kitasatospora purpeofusca TaxID=67352 RepID=UPI0035DF5E66